MMKLKPENGKVIFNFGIWPRHKKTGNKKFGTSSSRISRYEILITRLQIYFL